MQRLILWILGMGLAFSPGTTLAQDKPLRVVATVSSLGEVMERVGGEHVDVHVIVPPRLNPHYIQPKPSDVLKTKRAELFVYTGLHLELWLGPFLDAVGRPEVMPGGPRALDMSAGVDILDVPEEVATRAEGELYFEGNPHYWLNPDNAAILGQTALRKLAELRPEHQADYERNLAGFLVELQARRAKWQDRIAPFRGREFVAYHNEWPYFLAFTGLVTKHYLEPKPGIPPTPRHLQFIEDHIRTNRIPLIANAAHEPREASQEVGQRTGTKVLFLCHTVGELPECADFFGIFDHNIDQLVTAFQAAEER